MKFVEITRDIDSAPDAVWNVLTDAERLQNSNLGIARIEGRIAPGRTIKLWSDVSPNRAFVLKVVKFEENRSMVWKGGMPLGLFTGTRHFTITVLEGATRLHIREEFTGPLSSLIWRTMPDLTPSFEQFANGVKRLAEGAVS